MKVEFKDSTIPTQLKQNAFQINYDIDEAMAIGFTDCFFSALNDFMKINKKKDEPTAFEFTTLNGKFLFGAKVQYNKNEDPDKPGNWSYEYTFSQDDLAGINNRYLCSDSQFGVILTDVMYRKCSYVWNGSSYAVQLAICMMETIIDFLDKNATDAEPVELTMSDLFVATCGVEDGEKVMGIVPGEKSKIEVKEAGSAA